MDFVPLKFIDPLSNFLYTYVLIYLLVGAGIYFTIKTKGVQFRYFGRMIKQIFNSRQDSEGGISSFQAFAVGLASRVGTGNIAGVAIALLIVPRTWSLLRQAVNVLLEGTPPHLELGEIEAAMCAVAGVRHVHDLHVWTLTSGREAMSAHVAVDDVRESERLLETLHALLHARFGIDHTTIQLETAPPAVLRIKSPGAG